MNLLLVDDHTLFRTGFKMLIETIPGYSVSGEASNGREFLDKIIEERFDIIFMDIEMPDVNGIEAAKIALQTDPTLKIITLTMYGEEEYFEQIIQVGVKGFLMKNADFQEVKTAINIISQGGTYYSQALMQSFLKNLRQAKSSNVIDIDFSDRESEILHLICRGYSNQNIGEKLFISKRTVEKHRANLLLKTNCKNTAELVVYAVKNQIVLL